MQERGCLPAAVPHREPINQSVIAAAGDAAAAAAGVPATAAGSALLHTRRVQSGRHLFYRVQSLAIQAAMVHEGGQRRASDEARGGDKYLQPRQARCMAALQRAWSVCCAAGAPAASCTRAAGWQGRAARRVSDDRKAPQGRLTAPQTPPPLRLRRARCQLAACSRTRW